MPSFKDYIQLTKPRIIVLFALTGATTLILEGVMWEKPLWSLVVVFMIAVCGSAANSFNQYIERDIDAKMKRTKNKRPLVTGAVSPAGALLFSVVLSLASVLFFILYANIMAASLVLGTIFFYAVIYTIWLKPRTPYNIVIGGAAGAAAPLIAWAAIHGNISLTAFLLFAIVFVWTPPHFWALALYCKEDYENVGMPMLPNVRGDKFTRGQIFKYCIALIPLTLVQVFLGISGLLYLVAAVVSGFYFLWKAWKLNQQNNNDGARPLFFYSIAYLFILFLAMIADKLLFLRVF